MENSLEVANRRDSPDGGWGRCICPHPGPGSLCRPCLSMTLTWIWHSSAVDSEHTWVWGVSVRDPAGAGQVILFICWDSAFIDLCVEHPSREPQCRLVLAEDSLAWGAEYGSGNQEPVFHFQL